MAHNITLCTPWTALLSEYPLVKEAIHGLEQYQYDRILPTGWELRMTLKEKIEEIASRMKTLPQMKSGFTMGAMYAYDNLKDKISEMTDEELAKLGLKRIGDRLPDGR